jgi:hypothetical protein
LVSKAPQGIPKRDEGEAPYPWWVNVRSYCPNITSLEKVSNCHESFLF